MINNYQSLPPEEHGIITNACIYNMSNAVRASKYPMAADVSKCTDEIKDITKITKKMTSEGYNLDYLNIDYNITEAEKKIADIFDRLNVLNLTDSILELNAIVNYFDELYGEFDKEIESKKEYEENSRKLGVKCKKLLAIIKNLSMKIEDIKYSFDLSHEEVK